MHANKRLKTVHATSNNAVPDRRKMSISHIIRIFSRKYARIEPFLDGPFHLECETLRQAFDIVISNLGILEQCILCMVSKAMAYLVALPYKQAYEQSTMYETIPIEMCYKTLLLDTLAGYTHEQVAEQVQSSPLWSHFYITLFDQLHIAGVFSSFRDEEHFLCSQLIKTHFERKLGHKHLLFYGLAQIDGTIQIHYQASAVLNNVQVTMYAIAEQRQNQMGFCDSIAECIENDSLKANGRSVTTIDIGLRDFLDDYHNDDYPIILVYFGITYHALDLRTQTVSEETIFSNIIHEPFYEHPQLIAL